MSRTLLAHRSPTGITLFMSQIAELDAHIQGQLEKDNDDIDRLDSTPGINRRVAEIILAEAGNDMSRFPSARNFVSWTGLCPGQNESAGRSKGGKTRKGNRALRCALVEAARAAIRKKNCYLGELYRHLKAKRGAMKALIAVAHSLAVIIYHQLKNKTYYQELGPDHLDKLKSPQLAQRLTQRLEKLGYQVQIQPLPNAA